VQDEMKKRSPTSKSAPCSASCTCCTPIKCTCFSAADCARSTSAQDPRASK
jgi:hypothetical protein